MNLNTFSPTAKLLKKMQNYASGQAVTAGEVPNIAIINTCDVVETKKLVEKVILGAAAHAASVSVFNTPSFGFANKINPMTAKFAQSFLAQAASAAEAIIRVNLADAAVIVADCDITAAGYLLGAFRCNCPAVVLPVGAGSADNAAIRIGGKIAGGKIISTKAEELIKVADRVCGYTDELNSVSTFFVLLEAIGFTVENASVNKRASGAQLFAGILTGEKSVTMAKDIVTPKKLLTKNALSTAVTLCAKIGGDIGALELLTQLFKANEIKVTYETLNDATLKNPLVLSTENQKCGFIRENGGVKSFIDTATEPVSKTARVALVKGSACAAGGYVQYDETTPLTFSGKAWVYQTLEEADRALLTGSIPAGSVVVLLNCVGVNVTAFALAIEGMGMEKEVAIATDGVCDKTAVLCVTTATPSSLENEEFANIFTGDVLEIDVTRGRFNTAVLAKDQKTRAKKNTTKKAAVYF